MMRRWAFIDNENTGGLEKVDLSVYEKAFVFLGAKQPRLDFGERKYDKPIELNVIQIKQVQPNNLDFHLAYYLGKLDAEVDNDICFEVVSNDNGFGPLIGHVSAAGRVIRQVKTSSPASETPTQQLISRLILRPKAQRPQKVVSLRNFVASQLRLQGNEVAIQGVINQLVARKIVRISEDAVTYIGS
ncbi:PIN domain-containing protein [Neptunomonas marina]|nr:PIN domain-containing protein [Neptunomonas marina]